MRGGLDLNALKAWNGGQRKPLKWFREPKRDLNPNLKVGENERLRFKQDETRCVN